MFKPEFMSSWYDIFGRRHAWKLTAVSSLFCKHLDAKRLCQPHDPTLSSWRLWEKNHSSLLFLSCFSYFLHQLSIRTWWLTISVSPSKNWISLIYSMLAFSVNLFRTFYIVGCTLSMCNVYFVCSINKRSENMIW